MEPRTRAHLQTATENRRFAQGLVDDDPAGSVHYRWAVVAAFYAAVHLVNAYLWEQRRIEPRNHVERDTFVVTVGDLRSVTDLYAQLQDYAFRARYHPGFRLAFQDARLLIAHLTQIETTIASVPPSEDGNQV